MTSNNNTENQKIQETKPNQILGLFPQYNLDFIKANSISEKALIKLAKVLKEHKINEFYVKQLIEFDTVYNKLTVVLNPEFYDDNIFSSFYMGAESCEYYKWKDYLFSLEGNPGEKYLKTLTENNIMFEDKIRYKREYEGKQFVLADYIPSRNLLLIYIPCYLKTIKNSRNEYFKMLLKEIDDILKYYKPNEVDAADKKKQIIIDTFRKSTVTRLNQVKTNIMNYNKDIGNYTDKITSVSNDIYNERKLESKLKEIYDSIDESLVEQVELSKNFDFVKEISFGDKGIIIKYKKVSLDVKGEQVNMGNYTVTIIGSKITIKTDTPVEYREDLYHSCHIMNDSVCFGQQSKTVSNLLTTLQIKKLIHFLWTYLNTYNPSDTYLSMDFWIAAQKNDGVVPEDMYHTENEEEEYCENCGNYVNREEYNYDEDMCYPCWEEE